MIGFRVDANLEIGTGHLMRCLSIAKKLKLYTDEILFIIADEQNIELIEEKGFQCIIIDSHYKRICNELDLLCDIIKEYKVTTLVIDSYFVTQNYLNTLRKFSKVFYIDDLHEMYYPCDVLVNYTIFAKDVDYSQIYNQDETKLLLGCQYAPLRDEFENLSDKKIKDRVEKILVLSGGTDNCHFVLNFVRNIALLKKYSKIQFQIICGRYNKDKNEIKNVSKQNSNISIYENLTQLRGFMEEADVAISAGGTTLYELAACGTPTIGYSLADNQLENLKTFAEEGYMESVEDIREAFPTKKLIDKLEKLADAKVRSEMSRRMKKLVDGEGCSRLAEEIMRL